jgi:hypothetical protein
VTGDSKPRVFNFGRAVQRGRTLNRHDPAGHYCTAEDAVPGPENPFAEEFGRGFWEWINDDGAHAPPDECARDRAATDWWLGLSALVAISGMALSRHVEYRKLPTGRQPHSA